jgi:urea transporter
MPDSTITAGLAGYNGALIGAASYATWGEYPPALAATVVGAFAGAAITTLCAWVLQRRGIREFALPVLTAPFCITSGIMALLGARYVPTAPVAPLPAASPWAAGLKAVLGNISEVILVDRPLTGLLILAGLTIAAWRVGLAALLGAVGEFLIDLATGQDTNKLLHGLLGYSGVLVTIALGVVFVSGSWQRRTLAAAAGLAVSQAVATALAQTPVPAYTWPFIVPTWLILIALALWDRRRRHSSAQRPWPAGPATAAIRP